MAILHLHVFELHTNEPSDDVTRTKSILAAVSSGTAIADIAHQSPAMYYPFSTYTYIAMAAVSLPIFSPWNITNRNADEFAEDISLREHYRLPTVKYSYERSPNHCSTQEPYRNTQRYSCEGCSDG